MTVTYPVRIKEEVFNVTHPVRIKGEDFDFVKDRTVVIFWRNKHDELIGTPCRLPRFFISILEKNGFVEKKEED